MLSTWTPPIRPWIFLSKDWCCSHIVPFSFCPSPSFQTYNLFPQFYESSGIQWHLSDWVSPLIATTDAIAYSKSVYNLWIRTATCIIADPECGQRGSSTLDVGLTKKRSSRGVVFYYLIKLLTVRLESTYHLYDHNPIGQI